MKANQIWKAAVMPILTILALFSVPNTALADYLTSEGYGGEYRYELWSSDDGQKYYLKIWDKDEDPKKDRYYRSGVFKSSREALIHFDCQYTDKSLPQCPKNR